MLIIIVIKFNIFHYIFKLHNQINYRHIYLFHISDVKVILQIMNLFIINKFFYLFILSIFLKMDNNFHKKKT